MLKMEFECRESLLEEKHAYISVAWSRWCGWMMIISANADEL